MPMVFEQIEKIKQQYTDKYVVVDAKRPELARFASLVGQVRTVNMSGRALVEFLDYSLNVGRYDIDVDYLKVVDKPAEKEPAAKKPAAKKAAPKKPAGEGKKLSPLEMARMQDAGKKGGAPAAKPAAKAKMSVAEMLEAARTQQGASTAEKLEAARTGKSSDSKQTESKASAKPSSGGKLDRSKMSVADMLAAARGNSAAAPAAEEAAEEPAAVEEPAVEEAVAESPAEPASDSGSTDGASSGGGRVDKSSMSVDEMVAWCREHDAS